MFYKYMDQTIERAKELEKRNKDNILALFWLGAGYGYKARHHSVKGNWWAAYRNGKRTKHYFERVVSLAPDDYDPYLGLGIYHYYAEVVPKIIRIFDFILNMGGDKDLGLKELETTLDRGFFTKNEAKFFLVDIFLNYENRPWDALPFLVDLTYRFPGNKGFKWQLAELYTKLLHHDAAARIWRELADTYSNDSDGSGDSEKRATALVNLGEQTLRTGKFAEAQSILHQVVKMSDRLDPTLLSRAHYALALILDLSGEKDEALHHYEKVVEIGQGEMVKISKERVKSRDELPLEILHTCLEILATADTSDKRVKSFTDQVNKRLSTSNQKEQNLYFSTMENVGKYYLFHGLPSRAENIFTEILRLGSPKHNDFVASHYELRGIAKYRLNRFTEAVDDFKRAYKEAKDDERDRIEKDIGFIRASIESESASSTDQDSSGAGQEKYTTSFTFPDRGQLGMSVVGDFNDWDPQRGKMNLAAGKWIREFELTPERHTYYFLINGRERRIDPNVTVVERQSGTFYTSIRNVDF